MYSIKQKKFKISDNKISVANFEIYYDNEILLYTITIYVQWKWGVSIIGIQKIKHEMNYNNSKCSKKKSINMKLYENVHMKQNIKAMD